MTQIWAHRGSSRDAPENTLPAFELAVAQGADGIELDVQLTADGIAVVIHDETLDRTTNGSGKVSEHTLADLQRLDASAGHPDLEGAQVPTLAAVLELLAPSGRLVNIELKNSVESYPGLEETVLAEVSAFGIADRVVLSTFNHYSLKKLQRLGATSELGMVYSDPLYKPWRYAAKLGVTAIHPPARFVLSAGYLRKAQAAGIKVRPWVVNSARMLERMFRWGADGVFTDVPEVAAQVSRRGR